ncbi:Uncharacterised protein [Cedecea neteri]|uniref:Uncharacterized protein n=1 Tax=Cedecea neteri TaxID=158822 RepID=A0A2X2T8R3_9ENTR|nr:Uncharacterised protein [Cedecea neteri]
MSAKKFIAVSQHGFRLTGKLRQDNHRFCKHPGKPNHSLLEIFRHTDYVP